MKKNLLTKILLIIGMLGFLSFSPVSAFAATLSFDPAVTTFNRGCYGSIKVNVDTQGVPTDGTDAIIFFDPASFTQVTITNGTIYSDYPGSNVDVQNKKITIAGLASVTQPFTGAGTLATINFFIPQTAVIGSTPVTFDFDPTDRAKTTDSNVFEKSSDSVADVLTAVTNGTYTIGTGSCASSGAPGAPGTGGGGTGSDSASINPNPLPIAGTQELTYMVAIVGTTLTILGLVGFFIL
jgi:hypothetical protein